MIIGIDVDEVLVPFSKTYFNYAHETFGAEQMDGDKIPHYRYDELFGITLAESFRRVALFYNSEHFKNMPLHDGAKEVITELSKKHKLIAVTSRFGDSKEFTRQWLEKEFPKMFSNIHFSAENHYDEEYKKKKNLKEKAEVCKELGISLMIEDSIPHSLKCAEAGIKVLLFDRSWNHNEILPANITRIYSWKEVLEKI